MGVPAQKLSTCPYRPSTLLVICPLEYIRARCVSFLNDSVLKQHDAE